MLFPGYRLCADPYSRCWGCECEHRLSVCGCVVGNFCPGGFQLVHPGARLQARLKQGRLEPFLKGGSFNVLYLKSVCSLGLNACTISGE